MPEAFVWAFSLFFPPCAGKCRDWFLNTLAYFRESWRATNFKTSVILEQRGIISLLIPSRRFKQTCPSFLTDWSFAGLWPLIKIIYINHLWNFGDYWISKCVNFDQLKCVNCTSQLRHGNTKTHHTCDDDAYCLDARYWCRSWNVS